MCVCLGYAEPQNWFNPGVGVGLYSIISDLSAFLGQLLRILTFYFNIFVYKYKIENKKKKKKAYAYFQMFWVGQQRNIFH